MVNRKTLKTDLENAMIGKVELTNQALSIICLQLLKIIEELEERFDELKVGEVRKDE